MSDTDEIHIAAATIRTLRGPAAEPLAHLLDVLAQSLHDEAAPFREETLATARAINGGKR
jgi:hypothetical protein